MSEAGKRFELSFWAVLPGAITLLSVIACLVPKHVAGFMQFMPLLPVLPIFYWGMVQAREMPYWFVFLVGLLMDAATGMPLGLSSLLYIFFLALVHAQRKTVHKEGFIVTWGYFSLLLALVAAINWAVLSLYYSQPQGVLPAFIQWLLTVGCYPVLHKAFDRMQDYIAMRRWKLLHRH